MMLLGFFLFHSCFTIRGCFSYITAVLITSIEISLRKQAYSNILKILKLKNENVQIKVFIFLLKT